jgi:hypothetical protein
LKKEQAKAYLEVRSFPLELKQLVREYIVAIEMPEIV